MEITEIIYLLVSILISVVVNSLVVWFAGKSMVGSDKAKFSDAVWIVILGSLIGGALNALLSGILGTIVVLLLWLYLIKHFFDCGWLKALVIAIIAVIIMVIVGFIIGLLVGVTLFTIGF
ncbi:MAG: hypothetical protein IAX21_01040 [Candidatus Bathyarchaeota archaeon]|nr:hypothetical protein [Candidatus Bathyarchaeum tardum]WGM90446.1 MAG: hypothetical protein NUK63_04800 [Candidatus Bathyarchaeum tardum]WNZ29484.1 MAG: hypothetical protein IAX21_01040 [Candidatus Bathyarchaeota archaeon]